jgi:beta-phosphoglucomutase-like phosphatase (HAD superfamily)
MVDAVLLALEGVVFDTRELRRLSLSDALVEQGLAPTIDHDAADGPPRAAVERSLGLQAVEHDPVLVDLLIARTERSFSDRLATSGAAFCDGARAFVEDAAGAARLAVIANGRRSDAETMLRLSSLGDFFSVVVATDDTLNADAPGGAFRVALARLGKTRPVTLSRTLALEHGLAGIRAVRDSGITCVAIGPLEAHVAMEADTYVPTLAGHTLRSLEHFVRTGEEQVQ